MLLVLWQNLAHGLFHTGKGALLVGSRECGSLQAVLGSAKDLVAGAFSSLPCYSERQATINILTHLQIRGLLAKPKRGITNLICDS